jgi:chitodextrinase
VQTAFTTNSAPDTPVNEQPADGQGKAGLTPTLRSSAFVDADAGESHLASQWRVSKRVDGQSTVVFDSGEDKSNLTQLQMPDKTLEHQTTYYWQVRYEDSQGSWSSWSAETNFGTGAPPTVPAALLVAAAAVAVVAVVAMTAPLVVPL